MRRRKPRKFLIFSAIVLTLAIAGLYYWSKLMNCGSETKARNNILTLQALIMQYTVKFGGPPAAAYGLRSLVATGLTDDERLLKDPWGEPVRYRMPGVRSGDKFDVYSTGHDGVDGNEDDIGNWEPTAE